MGLFDNDKELDALHKEQASENEARYKQGMVLFRAGKYDDAFSKLYAICPLHALGEKGRRYPDA